MLRRVACIQCRAIGKRPLPWSSLSARTAFSWQAAWKECACPRRCEQTNSHLLLPVDFGLLNKIYQRCRIPSIARRANTWHFTYRFWALESICPSSGIATALVTLSTFIRAVCSCARRQSWNPLGNPTFLRHIKVRGGRPGFELCFSFIRVQTWVQLGFEEFELFQGSENSILNLGST